MDMISGYIEEFVVLFKKPRQFINQAMGLALIVFSALMLWKGLIFTTNSESPVVVVLSGSMEPGMYRGDILFLTLWEERFAPGDVTVFTVEGRGIPIVHRVLNVHQKADGHVEILTKGDNNRVDDRGLYNARQLFINRKDVMGRAFAFLPHIGMITIWLNDYPWLKYMVLGLMSFFVMIGRDANGWF